MTVSRDYLAMLAKLRAFIGEMSGVTGTSVSMALTSLVDMLERQLCPRSDDMEEALRRGGQVQLIRVQPASRRRRRTRY
jgi:hypothetical protein